MIFYPAQTTPDLDTNPVYQLTIQSPNFLESIDGAGEGGSQYNSVFCVLYESRVVTTVTWCHSDFRELLKTCFEWLTRGGRQHLLRLFRFRLYYSLVGLYRIEESETISNDSRSVTRKVDLIVSMLTRKGRCPTTSLYICTYVETIFGLYRLDGVSVYLSKWGVDRVPE